jgi:hypothetical protein
VHTVCQHVHWRALELACAAAAIRLRGEPDTSLRSLGAHLGFYPSDVRIRLLALSGDERFLIRINEDKWHPQDIVVRPPGKQRRCLIESYRIDALPALLEAVPPGEVLRRQRAAMAAFAQVRDQRCFEASPQPMAA